MYVLYFGDTPQRQVYNDENDKPMLINSGAYFVRDQLNLMSKKDLETESLRAPRDGGLPLASYKAVKTTIIDAEIRRELQATGVNNVYRLNDSEPMKNQASRKRKDEFSNPDTLPIVVVWTDSSTFDNLPKKADLYIWIATKELPDADFLKKLDGEKVIITQGDTLRLGGAKISRGLSWEETALNTVWQYNQNREVRNKLHFAQLLIVTFGFEGAMLLNSKSNELLDVNNQLYFHSTKIEGDFQSEFKGYVPEAFENFVARIVSHIIDAKESKKSIYSLSDKLTSFLSLQALTHILGYDNNSNLNSTLFTDEKIKVNSSLDIVHQSAFSSVVIPDHNTNWSIQPRIGIDEKAFVAPIDDLKQIVEFGAINAKLNCPILRIGALEAIGRSEIEAYAAIKNLIRKYVSSPFQGKPLSIAVFGQPGSGKSFGVKEIGRSIFGEEACSLEYNLSQYGEAQVSSLFEAFHDIQDRSISGSVPFVFFDEFDCHDLAWLKCFLMPMQDGEFLEHGRKRPLGKCIFIFAGGRFHSYQALIDEVIETKNDDKKVTDFLSRIKGYIDITGVNPERQKQNTSNVNTNSELYIIKRAMILSNMLNKINRKNERNISLSEDVLRAFMYTREFKHGARSMEAILEMSYIPLNDKLEMDDMPSSSQLELHVNSESFNNRLRERIHWNELVGRIARKYASNDEKSWEVITIEAQYHYCTKAETAIKYILNNLGLGIQLCGDKGKTPKMPFEYKQGLEKSLVLFSDHGEYKKIPNSELDRLIMQTGEYLGSNGLTDLKLPQNAKEKENFIGKIRGEVIEALKPFDIDPQNTGFYLYHW